MPITCSEFEAKVIHAAMATKGPSKHAAHSALLRLEQAIELVDNMPEVAAFLAITAEEEAATSAFQAIKRHRYERADELELKSHSHKQALYPFLLVMKNVFHYAEASGYRLVFQAGRSSKEPELLRIVIPGFVMNGEPIGLFPDPPLHIVAVAKGGKPHDFQPELKNMATANSEKTMSAYVRKLANKRNQVLYASASGLPRIEEAKAFIADRQRVVMCHLTAYLLIYPHAKKQNLVQEALSVFLDIFVNR